MSVAACSGRCNSATSADCIENRDDRDDRQTQRPGPADGRPADVEAPQPVAGAGLRAQGHGDQDEEQDDADHDDELARPVLEVVEAVEVVALPAAPLRQHEV